MTIALSVPGRTQFFESLLAAHRLGPSQVRHSEIATFLAETPAEAVDVVLLVDVLEHRTRSELFYVLDGVFTLLGRHSACVARVPNAEGLYGMRVRYGDLTHEQAFTAKSAEQLFRTIGFRHVTSDEDRPVVHGVTSLIRRGLWEVGTLPHRVLLAAETGAWGAKLSQNLVIRAVK